MHRRKMVMAGILAMSVALSAPLTANAAPTTSSPSSGYTPSSNGTGGQGTPEMAQLQEQIDQLNAQMLAAADASNQAVGQASVAKDAATKAKADLAAAIVELEAAKAIANQVAADLYKQGPISLSQATLLSSNGPQDFIDKVVMTDQVGEYQVDNINVMLAAQQKQQDASAAADQAAAEAQAKADEAQRVSSETQTQLAAAQAQMNELRIKAGLPPLMPETTPGVAVDGQGVTGQITGEWALPATGRFTSCFCPRWGTFHQGIDIAGPIGTPIFSAGNGVVLRAGPASGFGLAVYIQHPTGEVTVYGHVDKYYVQAGQTVTAGQRIADIGNRGYSTGPHLHFEVQKGAYGQRVDPVSWLAARGIHVG